MFKVNKESLEKDYNMVELLLQNYSQIDFQKMRGKKALQAEEQDAIISEKNLSQTN